MNRSSEKLQLAVRYAQWLSCRRPMPFDDAVAVAAHRYQLTRGAVYQEAQAMMLEACANDPSLSEHC